MLAILRFYNGANKNIICFLIFLFILKIEIGLSKSVRCTLSGMTILGNPSTVNPRMIVYSLDCLRNWLNCLHAKHERTLADQYNSNTCTVVASHRILMYFYPRPVANGRGRRGTIHHDPASVRRE